MGDYRTFRAVVWLLAGCVLVLGLWGGARLAGAAEAVAESGVGTVAAGNREFAFDLYARLKDDPEALKQEGNLFFSPYSISTALAMTYAGARGETEKQMAESMHFSLPQEKLHQAFGALAKQLGTAGKEGGYELNIANSLWKQRDEGFLEDFLELVKDNYRAGINEVDFVNKQEREKARKQINVWVEKETKEKIKEIIGQGVFDKFTRLVLVNAIYFKGNWEIQFDKKNTREAPFMVTPERKVNVPLMYLQGRFNYWADENMQALELPYRKGRLSMVVLLPGKVDGLAEMEKLLSADNLNQWLRKLRKQEVEVYLPKFKMTWGVFELKNTLKQMGMRDAFELPPTADFSGMTGKKDLFITNVLHKAYVEVNEEGTEAAAATAVVMELEAELDIEVFRADHPFVFIIKDNQSGSVLFMGRVANPSQTEAVREIGARLPEDANGNFTILVSNQSFDVNPVDVKVFIDDKLAIDQEFDVGKGFRRQHNWLKFQFSLPKGVHRLRAESVKGQAKLEKEFEVKDKCWGILNYWYSPDTSSHPMPKKFSFGVSDKPIYAGD